MPATRVRVRPPHRHEGFYILGAFYGIGCGIMFALFVYLMDRVMTDLAAAWSGTFGFVLIPVLFLISLFSPPCCAALYMARCCQHRGPVYLSGQIVGTCYGIGILIAALVQQEHPLTGTPWWVILLVGGYMVVGGIVMGLINLLFRSIYYNFVAVLVEQDGTLCVTCGYPVTRAPSERCPECGTSKNTLIAPFGRIYRLADFLGRHARKSLCLIPIALIGAIGVFVWHELPVWRFHAMFGGVQTDIIRGTYYPAGTMYSAMTFAGMGPEYSRAVPGGPDGAVLIILQHREDYFKSPLIQLRIGNRATVPGWTGPGGRTFFTHRDLVPRVVCDLNERQTQHVLENNVPQALVSALLTAATDAGCTPVPTSQPWPKDNSDVVVMPDAHFPDAQSD